MKKQSIKHWAQDDRPREKLMSKGRRQLSDAELIAILLGSGNNEESALDLAQRIWQSVGCRWDMLARLSLEQLCQFKGIGPAKAVSIATALEVGHRRKIAENIQQKKIENSQMAFDYLSIDLSDILHEEFWVLYLNAGSYVLEKTCLNKGGFTESLVDIRMVYKRALELSSVAIILAHNHPSGTNKPSVQDMELTKNVKRAGKLLDIHLIDHIIITGETFYSFADNGNI